MKLGRASTALTLVAYPAQHQLYVMTAGSHHSMTCERGGAAATPEASFVRDLPLRDAPPQHKSQCLHRFAHKLVRSNGLMKFHMSNPLLE